MKIINISENKHKMAVRKLFKEAVLNGEHPSNYNPLGVENHDESIVGGNSDNTFYGDEDEPIGWNDDVPAGYDDYLANEYEEFDNYEDSDLGREDVYPIDDLSDGDLGW